MASKLHPLAVGVGSRRVGTEGQVFVRGEALAVVVGDQNGRAEVVQVEVLPGLGRALRRDRGQQTSGTVDVVLCLLPGVCAAEDCVGDRAQNAVALVAKCVTPDGVLRVGIGHRGRALVVGIVDVDLMPRCGKLRHHIHAVVVVAGRPARRLLNAGGVIAPAPEVKNVCSGFRPRGIPQPVRRGIGVDVHRALVRNRHLLQVPEAVVYELLCVGVLGRDGRPLGGLSDDRAAHGGGTSSRGDDAAGRANPSIFVWEASPNTQRYK